MASEDQFHHELLSAEEEKRLAKAMEKGDRSARQRLIECNLRLVVHFVNRLPVEDRHREDLVQEGNIGLIIAVDKFDWRKGTKFSTYATWWIRQRVKKAMPGLNEIGRLPQHIWDKFWRHQKTGESDVGEADLTKVGRFLKAVTSIEEELPGQLTSSDVQDTVADHELIRKIEELFHCLSDRKRQAIIMRFGIGIEDRMTLREMAAKMGISTERARQVTREAIKDLRNLLDVSLNTEE
jgi:RNA polymerase sigma factor (sigma-70 family)